MTPEQKYPDVCARLSIWADWSRGGDGLAGVNDEGHKRANLLYRVKRQREAAGEGSYIEAALMPVVVDEMETALVGLPDARWQRALTYQWVRRWGQGEIARRLGVSRMTLWAWRCHAYPMLQEAIYGVHRADFAQHLDFALQIG